VLIAQISDVHVGGGRYRQELLRTAIDEINAAEPDLVVIAGDLTDDGYPDQLKGVKTRIQHQNRVLTPFKAKERSMHPMLSSRATQRRTSKKSVPDLN
jgi:3',5'-cyclic AMP phosphodiesterase CpdA